MSFSSRFRPGPSPARTPTDLIRPSSSKRTCLPCYPPSKSGATGSSETMTSGKRMEMLHLNDKETKRGGPNLPFRDILVVKLTFI